MELQGRGRGEKKKLACKPHKFEKLRSPPGVPIELVSVTMKPENVSPSCKDIIISMLWEMNFYFQLYACMFCLCRKKTGGHGPSPSPCYSPDTVFFPNKVS